MGEHVCDENHHVLTFFRRKGAVNIDQNRVNEVKERHEKIKRTISVCFYRDDYLVIMRSSREFQSYEWRSGRHFVLKATSEICCAKRFSFLRHIFCKNELEKILDFGSTYPAWII